MIVFAGICPNSPLLLETVNKAQLYKAEGTIAALNKMAEELYASHPDVIVLISEHPTYYQESFSINVSEPFKFDLTDFGDLGFDRTFRPDIQLIDQLQRDLRKQKHPVTLTTDQALHFSSAVPLHFLCKELKNVKIIPMSHSSISKKDHLRFGQGLKDVLTNTNKRVAVIAAGDLSNALSNASPSGFAKEGPLFDAQFQEAVNTKSSTALLKVTDEVREKAAQTIYEPATILFGLLDRVNTKTHVLSYEQPFGVGFLVAHFILR